MCELTKSLIRIAYISFLRLKMIRRIDHVLLMVDAKYFLPVHLHVDERLVTERKPKTIYFLISPDKVSWIDPEGRSLGTSALRFSERSGFLKARQFPAAKSCADSINWVGRPIALAHDERRFNRSEWTQRARESDSRSVNRFDRCG